MYTFKKSMFAKVFLILMLIVGILAIYLGIKEHNNRKIMVSVLSFVTMAIVFPGILQEKVTIDDNQITQTLGLHPLFKPRIMKWEDVDYVVKDNLIGIPIYRLLSDKAVKTKYINISAVTDMDLMIEEIVKRAKKASVDIEIEILLREKKNKRQGNNSSSV
jgi:hypothetical protein